MAQTTNGFSMVNCAVEISTDNVSWADMSGYSNSVEWDGGEVDTADTHTFSGDIPVVSRGKKGSLTVTIKVVATEGIADPARVAQAAYDNATPLYVRWSPRNKVSGSMLYTTGLGIVTKPLLPQGESDKADLALVELALVTPTITPTQVA